MTHRPCQQTTYSGQDACYKGLKVWQKDLTARFGCPNFFDKNSTMGSKAFCWCGLGEMAHRESIPSFNSNFLLEEEDRYDAEKSANQLSATVTGGKCHNKKDGPALKKRGKTRMANEMKDCGNKAGNQQPPLQGAAELAYLTHCITAETHPPGSKYAISQACASCFAGSVMCSEQYCIEECACVSWQDPQCNSCMNAHCKSSFDSCSGLKSADAVQVDLDSIDEDILFNASGAEVIISIDKDFVV